MSKFLKSKSESILEKKGILSQINSGMYPGDVSNSVYNYPSGIPQVSSLMVKSVSQYRRQTLEDEVKKGLFRDGSSSNEDESKSAVTFLSKKAQTFSGSSYRGSSDNVTKQIPEVYSPLWLMSNLNLPRDRATINAWCRSFYALNPFVQNAINLHSTYPISKLNIKCSHKEVENFFNDMIEETDLMNICVQIAQEFYLLGESFVYADLDESKGKWSRFLIQNPDFMLVKRTVIADQPLIMLRPDENLKRIVFSNKPSDIEQRRQLNQHIIDSVKRGENIVLDNYHVSHIARKISPYEIRGTGLPVCIFKQLMLFDKLRECYSDDTEVLTDKGFKKINELINLSTNLNINSNYVNGVNLDENNKVSSIISIKEDFKVACVNPKTNEIEYHKPIEFHMSKYKGKMIHFEGKEIDVLVSPNHKMWVKENNSFNKKLAGNLLNSKCVFSASSNFISDKKGNLEIPIENYLKILGYFISEKNNGKPCESETLNKYHREIQYLNIQKYLNLYNINKNNFEDNLPRWIFDLNTDLLEILLDSLMYSYGFRNKNKYFTKNKQLADDIQEISFKCGFFSKITKKNKKEIEYCISWEEKSEKICDKINEVDYDGVVWCFEVPTGLFITRRNDKISINGNSKFAQADNMVNPLTLVKVGSADFKPTPADLENYRNIFESAQYDKDFKIFTNDAVTIERIGYGQGIYDISGDITQLIKEIYVGLQVPPVLMDGGADTTYANGGVALDVLRQRYMQFRNMMASWLKRKIFAPISKIQGFYSYNEGKKELIIPEIDWNHMSLFDAGDYINNLVSLTQGEGNQKRASLHSLYRSMGLEYDDEIRKMRKESIQNAIFEKEKQSLQTMNLNALRALSDDDEIPEPEIKIGEGMKPGPSEPLPGEMPGLQMSPPGMLEAPPPPPPSSTL